MQTSANVSSSMALMPPQKESVHNDALKLSNNQLLRDNTPVEMHGKNQTIQIF